MRSPKASFLSGPPSHSLHLIGQSKSQTGPDFGEGGEGVVPMFVCVFF